MRIIKEKATNEMMLQSLQYGDCFVAGDEYWMVVNTGKPSDYVDIVNLRNGVIAAFQHTHIVTTINLVAQIKELEIGK